MPIAAVPAYLGNDFSTASPGLRFGMYLPIWTERADQEREVNDRVSKRSAEGQEVRDLLRTQGMDATIAALQQRERNPLPALWKKNDFAARHAWKKVLTLNKNDQDTMAALIQRQTHAAQACANLLTLEATAIAPFTTGLGNEHPLENGFAFLNPYGLPYLPGSGVKGVLRQAARELASGDWGDSCGWDSTVIDALFGRETEDGSSDHVRGALSFWDVIPQILGDSLSVDIMTPHHGHYYQQKNERRSGASISPHDSGAPHPISFLTLPPGTRFAFHVQCNVAHLEHLAGDPAHNQHWQTVLTAAFEHAFEWLGFGAKTSVGYGAMQSKAQEERDRERLKQQAEKARELERAEARKRQEENAVAWEGARPRFNRANGALTVEKNGKTAIAMAPQGEELLQSLPADVQQKIRTNQFVRVTAYVAEGVLLRIQKA